MAHAAPVPSWFDASATDPQAVRSEDSQEMLRQWHGFMTARLLLGLVLVTLQTALYFTGTSHSKTQIGISAAYLVGTLASKLLIRPRPLGQSFNRVWGALVGLDLLTFSVLQMLQTGAVGASAGAGAADRAERGAGRSQPRPGRFHTPGAGTAPAGVQRALQHGR